MGEIIIYEKVMKIVKGGHRMELFKNICLGGKAGIIIVNLKEK